LVNFAGNMSQPGRYSNITAMAALIRASLLSTFKNPSAIIFAIAFPMVFILVFGFLGGDKMFTLGVAPAPGTDTTTGLYQSLKANKMLKWVSIDEEKGVKKMLSEGDIVALVHIEKQPDGYSPLYKVRLHSGSAQQDKLTQLEAIIKSTLQNGDSIIQQRTQALASVEKDVTKVKEHKTIDFVLPGQLGFSLLAGSVFGTAFIFFNLRETLVLKRFFSTPVRREVILLSEGISRMIFQLLGSIVIIAAGYFFLGYTLVNGFVTFLEMILLCALGILVFMGFGFTISGIAKSQNTIPPLSNIITLPQFLLAGTFFPISSFPEWLQPICKVLPLTHLNDALRKVAFDNAGLWDIKVEILVLLGWMVVAYAAATKAFKWE
jgi:ABC-2 type transport system permease protein